MVFHDKRIMESFIMRAAGIADIEDLFLWRNDPLTRKMSLSEEPVLLESHLAWCLASFRNPFRVTMIGEGPDGRKLGMVRFDLSPDGKNATVSINLNPSSRGRGWSTPLLRAASKNILETHETLTLNAVVKKINKASARCFLGSGYRVTHEDSDHLYFIRTGVSE